MGIDFKILILIFDLGRCVVAEKVFNRGEFLLQYAGKLLSEEEGEQLEDDSPSNFRFFFNVSGQGFW